MEIKFFNKLYVGDFNQLYCMVIMITYLLLFSTI